MEQAPETDAPQGEQPEVKEAVPQRRSARLSNRMSNGATLSKSTSESSSTMAETRRNPKRKASEAAKNVHNLPENLLDEALAPLSIKDIEEWEGWIELESEPVSFPRRKEIKHTLK